MAVQKRFSQKSLRRSEFLVVGSVAFFIAIMALAGIWVGLDDVMMAARQIDMGLLGILLLLSLANYVLRAIRWHLFSRALGIPVTFFQTLLYYFAGFALTTTPGKVGELLRLWFLEKRHKCRYERTMPLYMVDRISDFAATVVLCLLGLSAFESYRSATVVLLIWMAALVVLFARPTLLIGLVNFTYSRTKRWPRLFAKARTTLRFTVCLMKPTLFAGTLVLAVLGWFCEGYAFYLLLEALGTDLTVVQAVFVFCFSMLIGAVSMLPGGLGGAEATSFGLLLLLGMTAPAATAATAVIRLTTLWFAVILGFMVLPFALKYVRTGNRK